MISSAGLYPVAEDIISKEELTALIREITALPEPPSNACLKLPEGKNAAPRLICLDMKDWIYLGRAKYGLPCAKECNIALERLEAAIDAGLAIVPVTSINLLEIGEVSDTARRERLALFMVELSRNHALIDHVAIREREIHDALLRECLKRAPDSMPPLRSRLLRWGIGSAAGVGRVDLVGAPFAIHALMNEVLTHPRVSARALGRLASTDAMASGRAMDERWRVAEEQVRKETAPMSDEERWELESIYTLQEGQGAQQLRTAAKHIGAPWEEIETWLRDRSNRSALMRNVPSLDVELRLRLTRGRNPQHPTDRNDMKDLLFLSSTIPYANVVVTEKTWGHIVSAARLDEKYSTTVCRNLRELVPILDSMQTAAT